MSKPILPPPSKDLSTRIQGTWWLETREDYTYDGQKTIDPILGADPVGILSYAKSHFAAQFMNKNRGGEMSGQTIFSGLNNTVAMDGYDAYFGMYEANEETGQVAHTLIGSVNASNVGMTVYRDLRVIGEGLVIQLETATREGEPIIRTLTWKRIS